MTRRPMKEQPPILAVTPAESKLKPGLWWWARGDGYAWKAQAPASPGDILGVREALVRGTGDFGFYRTDGKPLPMCRPYPYSNEARLVKWRWKRNVLPSIFMPHAYCRYKFPLVRVWAEKLGDISEEDAMAEGVQVYVRGESWSLGLREGLDDIFWTPQAAFAELWEEIYGTYNSKLWVWVFDWGKR